MMNIVVAVAVVLPVSGAVWMTDYEAAKEKARVEKKAVLVEFTGSDWCHFCIVQKRKVLDKPAFEAWAADKFVCLEVDLPRRKRLPESLYKQNVALVKQYRVGGFPTMMVIDAQGHALGGYTGGMMSLADVQRALQPSLMVHRHLLQAEAEPQSRAVHLAAAYAAYPDDYRRFNAWLREALEQSDPKNTTLWRTTYAAEQQMAELDQELSNYVMKRAEMLACYDRYLAKAIEGNRSRILRLKAMYLNGCATHVLRKAKSIDDVLEARDLQLQAAECEDNPTERARRVKQVREAYAHPERML